MNEGRPERLHKPNYLDEEPYGRRWPHSRTSRFRDGDPVDKEASKGFGAGRVLSASEQYVHVCSVARLRVCQLDQRVQYAAAACLGNMQNSNRIKHFGSNFLPEDGEPNVWAAFHVDDSH